MQGTREEATVRRTEAELQRQNRLTAMEADCAATVQRIQEQHAQVSYAQVNMLFMHVFTMAHVSVFSKTRLVDCF
jgi:hypothetical protein